MESPRSETTLVEMGNGIVIPAEHVEAYQQGLSRFAGDTAVRRTVESEPTLIY